MKNPTGKILALALFALAVIATQARAQSIYTPYAFTNFAGLPRVSGTNDGTGSSARFNNPEGVAVDDAGNVYVADRSNHTIRMITPAGEVTTLAGLAGSPGSADGTGSAARFSQPTGVAVDSAGNVYVADSVNRKIRKITSAGVVTTLTSSVGFSRPYGVALDSATNIYVADAGNHTIREVTPAGAVTTIAGSTGQTGTNDGIGSAARFRSPQGVVVDSATNIYVGDSWNSTIRKLTPDGTNWVVTTLAGSPGVSGTNDGIGGAAQFGWPNGVALDPAGNIIVVNQNNQTIRKVTPAGVVTTLAGRNFAPFYTDGIGKAARFADPSGVAVDSVGNVYVGDMSNNRITKGTPVLQFDTSTLAVSNGFFWAQLYWTGLFGSNAVVEVSPDLLTWTPIQTNALSPSGLDMSVPLDTNQNQFFRARLVP